MPCPGFAWKVVLDAPSRHNVRECFCLDRATSFVSHLELGRRLYSRYQTIIIIINIRLGVHILWSFFHQKLTFYFKNHTLYIISYHMFAISDQTDIGLSVHFQDGWPRANSSTWGVREGEGDGTGGGERESMYLQAWRLTPYWLPSGNTQKLLDFSVCFFIMYSVLSLSWLWWITLATANCGTNTSSLGG